MDFFSNIGKIFAFGGSVLQLPQELVPALIFTFYSNCMHRESVRL